jgi:hypothetical protein
MYLAMQTGQNPDDVDGMREDMKLQASIEFDKFIRDKN